MAMATENRSVAVIPLNNSNYATWKVQCRMALIKDGLWSIVNGTEALPSRDTATADAISKFEARRDRALAVIVLSVEPSLLYLLGDPQDPVLVWKKLQDQFQKKSWVNKLSLRRKLYSLRLQERDSLQDHIKRITELFDELTFVGDNISDEDRVVHLLASLPDSYDVLVTALESNSTLPAMEVVVERLLHEERKLKDRSSTGSGASNNSALTIKGCGDPQQRKFKSSGPQGPRCHYCKRIGHIQRNCSERAQNERKPTSTMNQRHHSKGLRHRANNVEAEIEGDNSDIGLVLTNQRVLSVKSLSNWIVDSGATCHVCNDESQFKSITTLEKPIDIALGDGYTLKAAKQGTVEIKVYVQKDVEGKCILHDVLYAPELSYCLLSVPKATERGATVTFDNNKCCIINKKQQQIAEGIKEGRLYYLRCPCTVYTATTDNNIWHRRYGHLSPKYLQLLAKKKLVIGLDYETCLKGINFCESCVEGKQHRSQFPKSERRATMPLELVHSDVCGAIETSSLGGGRYFLTFIDDYSRYIWVYILKNKSDVFAHFKEWKALVEKSTEQKLKTIRTDNGGEYLSNEFQSYLKTEGVKHERTVPKNPEQNGVAERLNRTLVEAARTMLADAKLPKRFWAEALSTATYLRNRSPTQALDGITPYEAWNGVKPKVNHLRVFGCAAYAHIPSDERKKFDCKSKRCILLGYGCEVKGYRLYDPQRCRVLFSRDVIFDETKVGIEEQEQESKFDDSETSNSRTVEITSTNDSNQDEIPINEMTTNDEVQEDTIEEMNEEETQELRRSNRSRQPPDYYGVWVNAVEDQIGEPTTYEEAVSSKDGDKWKRAMEEEMDSIKRNNVWELQELPKGRKTVGSKWVFRKKFNEEGAVERYKARIVAQGYSQKPGLDYDETFCPVVRFESLRMLIALSVQNDLTMHQMDITSAFLNGDLKEEVYMRQPEGFVVKGKEHLVCKLNRSLYGLKQSPRCWNSVLNERLIEMGFKQSSSDPCIYIASEGEEFLIGVYVDDMILAGKSDERMKMVKEMLAERFEVKDMGPLRHFLGVKVDHNIKNGTAWIGQPAYTDNLLKKVGMENAKPVKTPMTPNVQLRKATEDDECFDQTLYQSAVGGLLYLSTRTRPDIAFAVSNVARFCSKPTKEHWTAIKRIMRYLRGTTDLGLLYTKSDSMECIGYSDADWGGDCNDHKSTSGFLFQVGGTAVSWKSKKQSCVALSTAEAEYMALTAAAQEAVWLRQLQSDLIKTSNSPTTIFEDNQSAICMAKNYVFHGRTKHIGIKYHYIREKVNDKSIELKYCPTEEMTADVLTKGLNRDKFEKLRDKMGLRKYKGDNLPTSEKEC